MTKEDLEEMCKLEPKSNEQMLFQEAIMNFLENYVCIPKGATLQYDDGRGSYADVVTIKNSIKHYRIKPSEPVYEYLWKYPSTEFDATTDNYLTEEEVDKLGFALWCKTETKRVRQ